MNVWKTKIIKDKIGIKNQMVINRKVNEKRVNTNSGFSMMKAHHQPQ